ncbi:NUDIX domain-containing protein [Candidatus Dependentiae bacterium]|nr:NUDIX domain-containing protein [Candidatus Dependentiae bacterium]
MDDLRTFLGGGVYPDCWHIPGGEIDKGEQAKDSVIREVKER